MEFVAEVLIALVQFICEVLLQIAGDVLAELGGTPCERSSDPHILRDEASSWLDTR